jgi:hypothetical protein
LIKSQVPTIQWRFGQDKDGAKQQRTLNKYLDSNKRSRKEIIESIQKTRKEQFDKTIDFEVTGGEQGNSDDKGFMFRDEEDIGGASDTISQDDSETIFIIEKMRQTGADFSTRDL